MDSDGDFVHKDSQLKGKGFYFRPVTYTHSLRFRTLFTDAVSDKNQRRFAYSYLHGHMTAMILTHFYGSVTAEKEVSSTPKPSGDDMAI